MPPTRTESLPISPGGSEPHAHHDQSPNPRGHTSDLGQDPKNVATHIITVRDFVSDVSSHSHCIVKRCSALRLRSRSQLCQFGGAKSVSFQVEKRGGHAHPRRSPTGRFRKRQIAALVELGYGGCPSGHPMKPRSNMVRPAGIEPTTTCLEGVLLINAENLHKTLVLL